MSRIVDNAPVGVEPMTDQERCDLVEKRADEEYQAMCDTVRAEDILDAERHGFINHRPSESWVHNEAMRRLKEKYAQE